MKSQNPTHIDSKDQQFLTFKNYSTNMIMKKENGATRKNNHLFKVMFTYAHHSEE